MEVNATLFVQAINFFLAYIMIRKLLLVPVIAIIRQQEERRSLMQTTIAQLEEGIDKAKRSRQQLWAKTREYFSKKSPSVSVHDLHVFKGITPEVAQVEVDPQKKQEFAKHATEVLTNVIVEK